jgi:hypothetical protein
MVLLLNFWRWYFVYFEDYNIGNGKGERILRSMVERKGK